MDILRVAVVTLTVAMYAATAAPPVAEENDMYCHVCVGATDNNDCNATSVCNGEHTHCLTKIFYNHGAVTIEKSCERMMECYHAEEVNTESCDNPGNTTEGHCAYCCSIPGCNAKLPSANDRLTYADDDDDDDDDCSDDDDDDEPEDDEENDGHKCRNKHNSSSHKAQTTRATTTHKTRATPVRHRNTPPQRTKATSTPSRSNGNHNGGRTVGTTTAPSGTLQRPTGGGVTLGNMIPGFNISINIGVQSKPSTQGSTCSCQSSSSQQTTSSRLLTALCSTVPAARATAATKAAATTPAPITTLPVTTTSPTTTPLKAVTVTIPPDTTRVRTTAATPTTASTAPVTVTIPPDTTTTTSPPKPTTTDNPTTATRIHCYQCDDSQCSSQHLLTCGSGQHYCINRVSQQMDGSRTFVKGCARRSTCELLWWQKTAGKADCFLLDDRPRGLPGIPLRSCAFCCQGNGCNLHTIPKMSSLYDPNRMP